MPRFVAPKGQFETATKSQELGSHLAALNPALPSLPKRPDTNPSLTRGSNVGKGADSTTALAEAASCKESTSHEAESLSFTEKVPSVSFLGESTDEGGSVLETPSKNSTEEEISEEQLRRIFEDEEIEHFLRYFTGHVREVRFPDASMGTSGSATSPLELSTVSSAPPGNVLSRVTESSPIAVVRPESDLDGSEAVEDSAWFTLDRSSPFVDGTVDNEPQSPPLSSVSLTLSERIAKNIFMPNLPSLQPNPNYYFSIRRARLQAERLYLVASPVYGPFFTRLWRYASWKDYHTSMWYCTIFWVLWFYNLLLPTLFAVILYTLAKRRIFPYPTLKELKDRRHELARAKALGEDVEKRFTAAPDFGLRDAWNVLRSVAKRKKKGQSQLKTPEGLRPAEEPPKIQVSAEGQGNVVRIDAQGETQLETDIKSAMIQAMTEISDVHERVRNIFLWRRPGVSRRYAVALIVCFLITLILPATYLAKLAYFLGGIFFWFVPPVILSLPPDDRARIPPPFVDAPTDAQFAMEMIALRVARGESIVPALPEQMKQKKGSKLFANDVDAPLGEKSAEKKTKGKEINWQKWGDKAARGFALAGEGKRVLRGDMQLLKQGTRFEANHQTSSNFGGQQNMDSETSMYPAHHTSGPGFITLTSTTLSFTQALSSKPKMDIHIDHIRGVKKTGALGGLSLKWGESEEEQKEEKFLWVGGRDEAFAKLVGWRGRHWVQT